MDTKSIFNLEGKVAVITGGAGALGTALAETFAQWGSDIVLTGRTVKTLEEAVQKVEATGRRALAVPCDVTSETANMEVVRQTLEKFGRLDILVTVAGIAKRFPAEEFPADAFDQVMAINVKGTFLACKAVSKVFIKQGFGKIITISSVRGFAGHPAGYAAYATSKGAVGTLTKQLATEWAKYNITVNCIAPTIFWTPLTKEVLEDDRLRQVFLSRIPMGRAAVVDDMVGAAIYFASPASDFTTGLILYVDGGCTAG